MRMQVPTSLLPFLKEPATSACAKVHESNTLSPLHFRKIRFKFIYNLHLGVENWC